MAYGRPGVYVNETLIPAAPVASNGNSNAAGAVLGAFPKGPSTLTLVTSWYDFTKRFGGFDAKFPATFGVNQFFVNGGTELYVQRVLGTITGSDKANAQATIPSSTPGINIGTATAIDPGTNGNYLRIQIKAGLTSTKFSVLVWLEGNASATATSGSTSDDTLVEQWDNLVFNSNTDPNFAPTVINSLSRYITLSISNYTNTPQTNTVLPLSGASDGSTIVAGNYTALIATDGSSAFDLVDRPLVLFAPELYTKFVVDGNSSDDATTAMKAVQAQMITWANSGEGYVVLDTAPGLTTSAALSVASGLTASSQAAIYYPNLYIADPLNTSRGTLRKIGPSGAVAGVYINTDVTVGPFKAPAGMQAMVRGAVSLERGFTSADLDALNSASSPVNAIRNIRGAGIVVMGARTLLQDGTANRYVNMRRSIIYIKKILRDATRFAVFQNNDSTLWAQLNTVITVLLNEYRNKRGLAGATPAESFYIKIDSENNTSATIAQGIVNIEVGVALQYPSEFVVINLSQITGQ